MELRRKGRQWHNTGLTIKTAQSVVFEVCSAAARCCKSLLNLQQRVRQSETEDRQREQEILCDLQIDTGLSKHYLLLGWCWSITCHSTILLFTSSSTGSPVWSCDTVYADHRPRLSVVQRAVRQELSGALGTHRCK